MFFKRIFTKGLAHYSYIIGDEKEAIVIDPQPNIEIYLEVARDEGLKITKILETHRNEDFIVGSKALAELTGAEVYISADKDLNYTYGNYIEDGDVFKLKDSYIQALHTPGHTLGHMSYVWYLNEDRPYMLFAGDVIFPGDIGRTDFYGKENLEKMTGMLYDSIFKKLLPLGDHVILSSAHGSGSACGGSIEDRPYTTLGYERKFNAKLKYNSKNEFITNVAQMMHKPKYFNAVEEINLKGSSRIDCDIKIKFKSIKEIEEEDIYLIDLRSQDAFSRGHISKAIYIPKKEVGSYIGLFVPTDSKISVITEIQENDFLKELYLDLRRMGYKKEIGLLSGGIDSWYNKGKDTESLNLIHPKRFIENIKDNSFILDVRKEEEIASESVIQNSINIPLQELDKRIDEVPKNKNIYVLCPSGKRSTIAASLLKKNNRKPIVVVGGIEGLKNI